MKSFRYENAPHYRVITEAEIRALIDGGTLNEKSRENAESVLALEPGGVYEIGRTGAV
jgi:hypothetical protein